VPRRDRIRRRSPVARWTGRILGLVGTAALLAVGVVAATMVLSAGDEEVVSPAPAATPTPAPEAAAGADKPKQPKLTRSQREERRQALDEVRRQGYTAASVADYKADHLLRVLIGKPVGTTPPGMRAFFFVDGEYIGQDATTASGKIRAGRQLEREITIVYTLYEPGDELCCPKGKETRVHYRWDGETLTPRETIPAPAERLPPTA
jgi:hypothetical protein